MQLIFLNKSFALYWLLVSLLLIFQYASHFVPSIASVAYYYSGTGKVSEDWKHQVSILAHSLISGWPSTNEYHNSSTLWPPLIRKMEIRPPACGTAQWKDAGGKHLAHDWQSMLVSTPSASSLGLDLPLVWTPRTPRASTSDFCSSQPTSPHTNQRQASTSMSASLKFEPHHKQNEKTSECTKCTIKATQMGVIVTTWISARYSDS